MLKISHIVNPVKIGKDRDLYFQQPITFETMRVARKFAFEKGIKVEFYAVGYPEDDEVMPNDFIQLSSLERSVLDYGKFNIPRKLPFFKDILDRLYEATDAEYLIQTNADIGLQPFFYLLIKRIIEDLGYDAFCINKRIIPDHYRSIDELPLMWAEMGNAHAGFDCFVFHRDLYPAFRVGKVCMGTPWSEATVGLSMDYYAKKFTVFQNAHATFHIGDPRIWRPAQYNDYRQFNTEEVCKVMTWFKKRKPNWIKRPIPAYFVKKLKMEVSAGYCRECQKLIR